MLSPRGLLVSACVEKQRWRLTVLTFVTIQFTHIYGYVFLLQVLSHNLYTVLKIPHDPVALEEHFQDDDDGPVSNHGYMPYLNKYILAKVLSLLFLHYTHFGLNMAY